ncbi:polyhydroxyalkanoic acid system family protein [Aurantimonas sp. Leaf443]|uniref:polyhydroxyalkanoic acid system family protein n=1 Tax=Aurantimonas sp. Leaf443 TaxID=1736378 RepID=UPI0006FEFB07|nr:polyhydroxyalkanoic acid system family protein [Aurantimonas sp. Leaf443]KQT82461.1 hypothetical protein ASG48_15415 [Aurantimonas sp. Leaf443]
MAETIKVDIPHRLGRPVARQRIEEGVANLKTSSAGGFLKVEHAWTEDRLDFKARAMGQTATGRLDVRDDHVHLEIDLPMMLAMFAEKLRGRLKREGQVLLEKK